MDQKLLDLILAFAQRQANVSDVGLTLGEYLAE